MFIITVLFCTMLSAAYTARAPYQRYNATRSTLSGIAEYRSALTLDWLAAEDMRQKELALAFETESVPPVQMLASECVSYEKPAAGKVARLMLELLKNLEGDDGTIIPDMIQALIRSKLLIETAMLEAEPDLDALVKTPGVMMGEPHATFPRILAMVWMSATDPTNTKKNGWCTLNKITRYLAMSRPVQIAHHMRNLDPVIARARFIVEEFIQHITPNMYDRSNLDTQKPKPTKPLGHVHAGHPVRVTKFMDHTDPTPALLQSPLVVTTRPTLASNYPPSDILQVDKTPELFNDVLMGAADVPRVEVFLFLVLFLL